MNELIDLRRQLIQGHLAQDQTREIKRHITVRLDWGNEWVTLALSALRLREWVKQSHAIKQTFVSNYWPPKNKKINTNDTGEICHSGWVGV